MAELPNWVYDIIGEIQEQDRTHPKLFFTSGAFEGYRQYDWCVCRLLEKVPDDVKRESAVIREYVRKVTKEDQPQGRPPAGDKTEPSHSTTIADEGVQHNTGCACPDIDVSVPGEGSHYSTVKGWDPHCPLHSQPDPDRPTDRIYKAAG